MSTQYTNKSHGRLSCDPLIGQIIDRYRLIESIGDGAMANVYQAQHTTLTDRRYAVKVLRPNMARKPQVAARFRREARILSKLEHPNIVSVIDAGTTQHGLLYMVLEYAKGKTLKELIKSEAPLGVERAANLSRQIASALSRVHALGFIHRDIKPDNIVIIRSEGREIVKILDFGIAGIIDEDIDATRLTEVNLVCGTPHYMAPEQASGADIGDPVDVYALGAILYELLTGRTPFVGPIAEVLMQKLVAEPPKPDFHGGLGPLALQLLSRKAEDRPTAVSVVQQIEGLQAAGWARPEDKEVQSFQPYRFRASFGRALLAAGIASVVAASGFGAMMVHQDSAAANAQTLAVAAPAKAPIRKLQPKAQKAVETKKTSEKKTRVRRKQRKVRKSKRASPPKTRIAPTPRINAALAKLSETQTVVIVEKPATKPVPTIKPIVAQDLATSQEPAALNARSQMNLPDSVQASTSGSRRSSLALNPIKSARSKAFSKNRRASAYRMSR